MPQSLASIYVHAVFSTKERRSYLVEKHFREEVHRYIGGISNRLGCQVVAVGGVEDHVHILARLGRTITVANWLQQIKRGSSSLAKNSLTEFDWQAGYGAFSISASDLDAAATYIRNQEEHHKKIGFQDEFRRLMREHGIEWDERYLWD